MKKELNLISISLLFFVFSFLGCKKLAELPTPIDRVANANVYTSNQTAIAVLTGIYSKMTSVTDKFTGRNSISLLAGLSADEFALYSGVTDNKYIGYYKNKLSVTPSIGSEFWSPIYGYIRKCNAALEGLIATDVLTPAVKQQLIGEAKFMRAFFYFYLINLFGDVPLVVSTDYTINTLLTRISKAEVYQQILNDLKDAQNLLSSDYLDATLLKVTLERVRPTKWTATALLARAYLFLGDYANAEIQSTALINNASLFSLSSLNNVFLKNSTEAIWQLQPTVLGFNTQDAIVFIIPSTGLSNSFPVQLSNKLLNSFETGDQRKVNGKWVDSIKISGVTYYYPFKYKINFNNPNITSATGTKNISEYLMVFRLAEQYLIRAEARVQQNNMVGAQSDLNIIRARAGLSDTIVNDKTSMLAAILRERQVELFSEWGHRWLDLKRTSNVDAVMNLVTPIKANGESWQSYQQFYPLPLTDLQTAPNLVQNSGY